MVKLRNKCIQKEQSLLFDLFKAFDQIESSHRPIFFPAKTIFSSIRAQHVLNYHLLQVPWIKHKFLDISEYELFSYDKWQ